MGAERCLYHCPCQDLLANFLRRVNHRNMVNISIPNYLSAYGMESLERLQGVYQDLVAFSETRLANIERLWVELEASVDDFRALLDKPPKNNASRESLATGTKTSLTVDRKLT